VIGLVVKIVWGITGCGDLLQEVVDELNKLVATNGVEMTTCLSKAGELVVRWYKLAESIKKISNRVLTEEDANTPFIAGPLQLGKYHSLLIAPSTGNTVAKIVHGIADTLLTNAAAQAQKGEVPVLILPVDQKLGQITTRLPGGEEKVLVTREIDIENVRRLRTMRGITVLQTPRDIQKYYSALL
jgi:archaeoflavoprotein AfpA